MMSEPEQIISYHTIRVAHLYEETRRCNDRSVDFAMLGLRSLYFIHGGAMIGLLTFLGNKESSVGDTTSLYVSFIAFGLGLFFALLSTIFSYLSEGGNAVTSSHDADFIYFHMIGSERLSLEQQELGETSRKWGTANRLVALASAAVSGALFLIGMFEGLAAIV